MSAVRTAAPTPRSAAHVALRAWQEHALTRLSAWDDVPAFERRARLRAKRHGLVTTLGGFDGRSQREINAWLNRETGVGRVSDASLEQLERSIELLLAALDRTSRRRAS